MNTKDDLIYALNNCFKQRIDSLIRHNQSEKNNAILYFKEYLEYVYSCNSKIYKHIENVNRRNCLALNKQYKDIRFEFVIQHIQLNNDDSFIKNKFTPHEGYVYFLKSDFGYKVGYSAKLMKRMNKFDVKLPFKFYLHSTIKCLEFKNIEKLFHELLDNKKINGEWFNLNEDDFIQIDKILENINLKRVINKDIVLH